MEKSPSERKPNRVFRGQIIRAAIAEAIEYGQGLLRPLQSDTECSGDYDDLLQRRPQASPDFWQENGYEIVTGIGAMDAGQLTMLRASDPARFEGVPTSNYVRPSIDTPPANPRT